MIPPKVKYESLSEAKVVTIFPINIRGGSQNIAGCHITKGPIKRGEVVHVLRQGKVIKKGKIETLKHFKDDVKEIKTGQDCGIGLENFDDFKEGDIIQTQRVITIPYTLKDFEVMRDKDEQANEEYEEEEYEEEEN